MLLTETIERIGRSDFGFLRVPKVFSTGVVFGERVDFDFIYNLGLKKSSLLCAFFPGSMKSTSGIRPRDRYDHSTPFLLLNVLANLSVKSCLDFTQNYQVRMRILYHGTGIYPKEWEFFP